MCHVVGVSPFACMTYAAAKACKEVLKDPATTIVQQVQTLQKAAINLSKSLSLRNVCPESVLAICHRD
eukprot:COSAG04_NODE_16686_length_492_cov_0.709924_1_plen_67_part_10